MDEGEASSHPQSQLPLQAEPSAAAQPAAPSQQAASVQQAASASANPPLPPPEANPEQQIAAQAAQIAALTAQLVQLQVHGQAATAAVHAAANAGAPAAALLGAQPSPAAPPTATATASFKAAPPKPFDGTSTNRLLSGYNVVEFLSKAERFFVLAGIPQLQWTFMVFYYLTGTAWTWYSHSYGQRTNTPWEYFKADMTAKYTPVNADKAARDALAKHTQTGSARVYGEKFVTGSYSCAWP